MAKATHYVNFAQALLYRGAGFDIVWRSFATVVAIGLILFTVALLRFRRTVAVSQVKDLVILAYWHYLFNS